MLTTGLKHGTLTVLTDGGPLEITTYRTEDGYSDGRHPDGVRFVTDIREDLARRDFTVGAMAWHPERGLCDPFGGQTDLQNGVLRAVGNADTRFQEDALRILRGLRFASSWVCHRAGNRRCHAAAGHRLDCIAAERIREELTGLLCGRYVQRTLMAYADLITSALPELAPMQGCQQQNPHHLYDVWGAHRARGQSGAGRAGAPVGDAAARQRQARLQDRGRARHRAFPGTSQGEPCAVARAPAAAAVLERGHRTHPPAGRAARHTAR